jgi:hypothetical protein
VIVTTHVATHQASSLMLIEQTTVNKRYREWACEAFLSSSRPL